MKMVIYKNTTFNEICVTPRKNYYAYVQNARAVQRFPVSDWTEQEVINYMCKYSNCTVDDFERPAY